ncbi:DUF1444 family protein [uncultured Dysgonomonas sp.]|uniref:DUF1444 family protein n=1 Tax=uncultured Dysgonomonas sp. TaxID=206096 RepID=A0A212JQ88_9BACT|nr:DUF1444 family protein [uncultured Dysgonomonas sp.]SBW01616.1 conserved hypothetical protein [uncultured Dysgonomonas sp.]
MIDLKKVFPRLKETYSNDDPVTLEMQDGKTITLTEEDSPVMKPFAQNLTISYALDMGTHYQFVPNRDLSEELTIEMLHEAALENMIDEIADNIQAHGEPADVLMITNGGNYEAAMLIWNDIWSQIESVVGGELYVAVPARDVLYVAPKSNPDAIERLSNLIKRLFDEDENAQGLMVRHIYKRGESGWEVVASA